MSFANEIKIEAMVACSRYCCICHKFAGVKMELHHIILKSEGGEDSFENCIPLCLECHADQSSYDFRHPKGTKYRPEELRKHRDNWYAKVQQLPSITSDSRLLDLDRNTYERIRTLLPWDGLTKWLKQNDFRLGIDPTLLDEFDAFEDEMKDPTFEFYDLELETLRQELVSSMFGLYNRIQEVTFADGRIPRLTVPREWQSQDPKHYYGVLEELASRKTVYCRKYDELARGCRRKLG